MRLANSGHPSHSKYRRQTPVMVDITAPLYWWKEFDTYKVGTTANSCSTMHKIHEKEFALEDFSYEHMIDGTEVLSDSEIKNNLGIEERYKLEALILDKGKHDWFVVETDYTVTYLTPVDILEQYIIGALNLYREKYLETKDKKYWWQMIQLLPSSYNQKRTLTFNYEVLYNIYISRKNHKLDEWHDFCAWIESLPYSEFITGERES